MEEKETNTYIDKLPMLLKVYNNRVHRVIKMSPKDAEKNENFNDVSNAVEEYFKKSLGPHYQSELKTGSKAKQRVKFKIGDLVRISKKKGPFEKGYYQSFVSTVYSIHKILDHLPVVMYKIKNRDNNQVEAGTWYASELQLVKHYDDTVFKIGKVLKWRGEGRNKQGLVKWKYWPAVDNSWLKASEIRKLSKE